MNIAKGALIQICIGKGTLTHGYFAEDSRTLCGKALRYYAWNGARGVRLWISNYRSSLDPVTCRSCQTTLARKLLEEALA